MRRIAYVINRVVTEIVQWNGEDVLPSNTDFYDVTERPEIQVGWIRTMDGFKSPNG